jgi:hypothetical protein
MHDNEHASHCDQAVKNQGGPVMVLRVGNGMFYYIVIVRVHPCAKKHMGKEKDDVQAHTRSFG